MADNRLQIMQWCLCSCLVLAAHLAVAFLLLSTQPTPLAAPKPRKAILISLAASPPSSKSRKTQTGRRAKHTPSRTGPAPTVCPVRPRPTESTPRNQPTHEPRPEAKAEPAPTQEHTPEPEPESKPKPDPNP